MHGKYKMTWRAGFLLTAGIFLLAAVGGCAEMKSAGAPAGKLRAVQMTSARGAGSDTVVCRIARGSGFFKSGWRDFTPAEFTLKDGQKTIISINSRKTGEGAGLVGFLDIAAQNILFCPRVTADGATPGARIPCASLYALDDDYRAGFKRTFDVPKTIIGGEITCAYAVEGLKKI